jgi:hypothetical protein
LAAEIPYLSALLFWSLFKKYASWWDFSYVQFTYRDMELLRLCYTHAWIAPLADPLMGE